MSNVDGHRFVRGVVCSTRSDQDKLTILLNSEHTPEDILDIICDFECSFLDKEQIFPDGWESAAIDKITEAVL